VFYVCMEDLLPIHEPKKCLFESLLWQIDGTGSAATCGVISRPKWTAGSRGLRCWDCISPSLRQSTLGIASIDAIREYLKTRFPLGLSFEMLPEDDCFGYEFCKSDLSVTLITKPVAFSHRCYLGPISIW
jgi:hypothetical protein